MTSEFWTGKEGLVGPPLPIGGAPSPPLPPTMGDDEPGDRRHNGIKRRRVDELGHKIPGFDTPHMREHLP